MQGSAHQKQSLPAEQPRQISVKCFLLRIRVKSCFTCKKLSKFAQSRLVGWDIVQNDGLYIAGGHFL
jgi:hypothetical protein